MTGAELAQQIQEARVRLLQEAASVPAACLAERPSAEEWSVLEVLAHLVDVDYYYLSEALAMHDRPGYSFNYFDDQKWKDEHPSIRETPPAEIHARLGASHQAVIDAASAMSEEELAQPGEHPRGIPYTVGDVLLRFPAHDLNHTEQIIDIRKRLLLERPK